MSKKRKKLIEPALSPEEIKEHKNDSYLSVYTLLQALEDGDIVLSHLIGDGKTESNDYSCTLSIKSESGELLPLCILIPLGVPIEEFSHSSREDLNYDQLIEAVNDAIEPLLKKAKAEPEPLQSFIPTKNNDKKLLN